MKFELDHFNGVIIDPSSLSTAIEELKADIEDLLAYLGSNGKSLAWISLPIIRSESIPLFVSAGFTFHSCVREELTLVRQPSESAFVPFIPTHTIGASAIVLNESSEILLVKERGTTGFKLPGGYVESGEKIQHSVQREVLEETGIQTTFESIVGFITRHTHQLGKSNLHFICRMKSLSQAISILDTAEIEDAKWVSLSSYISESGNSLTDRQLVSAVTCGAGLIATDFTGNIGPHRRDEIYISRNP
ncbi:NUDIX domain-containing protein [Pseudomonas sp. ICMP22404]|uniref:NUDIX hydrolase n=1 Tax=Pseudomonas sp. ICMP22404 TaxID=2583807 RepID=UPI0011184BDD|nr:NUDIX domain-containing protein [Pseudomonas sp. ICMP22404]TNF83413.1 NUDIX domain-containing protein [Pseudomonas sp. ICMP22404]